MNLDIYVEISADFAEARAVTSIDWLASLEGMLVCV